MGRQMALNTSKHTTGCHPYVWKPPGRGLPDITRYSPQYIIQYRANRPPIGQHGHVCGTRISSVSPALRGSSPCHPTAITHVCPRSLPFPLRLTLFYLFFFIVLFSMRLVSSHLAWFSLFPATLCRMSQWRRRASEGDVMLVSRSSWSHWLRRRIWLGPEPWLTPRGLTALYAARAGGCLAMSPYVASVKCRRSGCGHDCYR